MYKNQVRNKIKSLRFVLVASSFSFYASDVTWNLFFDSKTNLQDNEHVIWKVATMVRFWRVKQVLELALSCKSKEGNELYKKKTWKNADSNLKSLRLWCVMFSTCYDDDSHNSFDVNSSI